MSKKNEIQGIELLRFNHAGVMLLKDGRTVNYGVIRITEKEVVYYTGKGLREMWKPNMNEEEKAEGAELKKYVENEGGEQQLIDSEYIAVTPFDEIERIIF
jgi:hypothetical protein